MNWINLVWLLVGLGLGLASSCLLQKSGQNAPLETPQMADRAEHRQLLDQLKQAELAYQMASEMSQFKGGFLARTSHELRSPLNGLIGMHQLILANLCDSPEEEREFIAQANESALKMVAVLDSLIDVSKAEHGTSQLDLQPIQLAQLLQEIYTLTHLQAKNRNFQLQIHYPDPELYIQADPRRLRQILLNLVSSAIAEMQEGEIRVSVQPMADLGCVYIWIDDDRPATARSEPIDLLQSVPNPAAIVPSSGLTLLVSQTLLTLMQGRLDILPVPADSDASPSDAIPKTRIQCSLPLITLEPE